MQKLPMSNEQLLRTILGVLGLIAAVAVTVSAAQHQPAGGSSNPTVDDRRAGYVAPDFETGQKLEEIRQDFFTAVRQLRSDDALPPVSLDPELQRLAQQHAEGNAVTKTQPNLEPDDGRDIGQVSASMPLENASGHAFLELIIHSQKHMDVLLNPEHRYMGVGVAYGHGEVWVVVAFSH
ncbi:CAP domain-containing protein [Corynebacterium imitans]|uniref:CAP domain-containing protein n=1 Tax=Corynebacterium imitans TaxID=156978 RepID=UPI001EF21F93|nr:CAP domain-containing protein [Corynebacterium imitans]MCG7278336.1 CAP domain-containing protein [Corynebacterium imitans]